MFRARYSFFHERHLQGAQVEGSLAPRRNADDEAIAAAAFWACGHTGCDASDWKPYQCMAALCRSCASSLDRGVRRRLRAAERNHIGAGAMLKHD